jgi:hypothetical protein
MNTRQLFAAVLLLTSAAAIEAANSESAKGNVKRT